MGKGHRFTLPDNSTLPLRDHISEAVGTRLISKGDALPSCRALSADLKVSRNTVFAAYARLPVWSGDSDGSDSDFLVEQLQKRLLSYRGLRAGRDEILITAGSQNALFILGMLSAGKAGAIAVENPGYPEARNAFVLAGNEVIGVPIDTDGMDISAIPKQCKVVYVTASHQLPRAATLPLQRRRDLMDSGAMGLACSFRQAR
ncbi:MAG: aminotransferase class I/II-fold pyridoxal phosphate-dependent enzyme [Roseovarius indicus]